MMYVPRGMSVEKGYLSTETHESYVNVSFFGNRRSIGCYSHFERTRNTKGGWNCKHLGVGGLRMYRVLEDSVIDFMYRTGSWNLICDTGNHIHVERLYKVAETRDQRGNVTELHSNPSLLCRAKRIRLLPPNSFRRAYSPTGYSPYSPDYSPFDGEIFPNLGNHIAAYFNARPYQTKNSLPYDTWKYIDRTWTHDNVFWRNKMVTAIENLESVFKKSLLKGGAKIR